MENTKPSCVASNQVFLCIHRFFPQLSNSVKELQVTQLFTVNFSSFCCRRKDPLHHLSVLLLLFFKKKFKFVFFLLNHYSVKVLLKRTISLFCCLLSARRLFYYPVESGEVNLASFSYESSQRRKSETTIRSGKTLPQTHIQIAWYNPNYYGAHKRAFKLHTVITITAEPI